MIEMIGADTRHEEACDRAGQGELLAVAIQLAAAGAMQEAIVATLRARFPGLPNENYYQNPAAEAVMRRVVLARQRAAAREADLRRLRAKGLPESLADRGTVPEPRPHWTDSDLEPDWHGPLHTEVAACTTAYSLLALCEHYDLHLSVDALGLKLSRRIAGDSDLLVAIRRNKPAIMALLVARDAALDGDEP